jgi:O-antigen ligase
VRGDRRWRWTARWLVAGALLQAAYGLVQEIDWYWPGSLLPALETVFTSNPAILSGSEQLHLGDALKDVPRLRGTVCEPLYLGNYLLAVLPLLPLTGWGKRSRAATGVVLGLLLVLTWSRGAWLAALAALVLAAVLSDVRPQRRWLAGRRWLPPLLALALVLAVLGPDRMLLPIGRLAQSFSDRDWSNLTRLYSMQAAWRAFLLSPVVGVGWGQFGWHFPLLVDAAGLQSQFTWPVVNCFPLQVLCETGVMGFVVLVAATTLLARAVLRRRRDPVGGPRVIACAVATAGVWLQLLTFSQYNLPHIWLAPGLLLAALGDASAADDREGAA